MSRPEYHNWVIAKAILYSGDDPSITRHLDRLRPTMVDDSMVAALLRCRDRCLLEGHHKFEDIIESYGRNEGNPVNAADYGDAYETGDFILTESSVASAVNLIFSAQDSAKLKELAEDLERGLVTMQEIGAICSAQGQNNFEDTLTLKEAEDRVDAEGTRGRIPMGFSYFDRSTRGLPRGRVSILAAKPGVGKTDFALACAINMLRGGKNVFFASLEMDYYEIVGRLRRSTGTGRTLPGSMTLDTAGRQTVGRIAAQVAQQKPELVIVDYLQILDCTGSYDGLYARTSEISNQLRAAAKGTVRDAKTAPAWLVLSQLSRNTRTEHDRPVMADLRDSGAIEQDADMVMFLHEPNQRLAGEQTRQVELSVAKNRGGPCGYTRFTFTPGSSRWEE
jgi:replicative DNA helicase